MAKSPSQPSPQQQGGTPAPAQQQGQQSPASPQQGQPIFRDWAAI